MKRGYLYATIFVAGAVTMGVEFGASRLLGNAFGSSNLVWAVIIGLVLVYLTVGNWLGGKLADRFPTERHFSLLLAMAGGSIAPIPLISRPILRIASNAFDELTLAMLFASFISVLVLFLIPVVLLGMVTPFALKLSIGDMEHSGQISGRVSATSTLGSFVGTFLTVLVLIPTLGTWRTFLLCSLILLLFALPGLKGSKKMVFIATLLGATLVLALLLLGPKGTIKNTSGQIYEKESSYNYIQVLQEGDFRFLRLNEGQGMHSVYHPTELFYAGPWEQFLVGPYFNAEQDVKRIAILGLAAGTTARQASVIYPNATVDGFELDPAVVETGRRFFGLNELLNLQVHEQDARWGIRHSAGDYDIVAVDAYQAPYIPPQLVTLEFFEEVSSKMSAQGVLAINVGRSDRDRSLVNSLSHTLQLVFPRIFVLDLPDSYNSIIFACKNPESSWIIFESNYALVYKDNSDGLLSKAMSLSLGAITAVSTEGILFTDDLAPIEAMTNRMVINFLREE